MRGQPLLPTASSSSGASSGSGMTLVPNSTFATRATKLRAFHATETPELRREQIAHLGRGIAIVTATTDNARTFLDRFFRSFAMRYFGKTGQIFLSRASFKDRHRNCGL